jgi:hypothetical protein
MDKEKEIEILKTHLMMICRLHDNKSELGQAIRDSKSLLLELYPEPVTEWPTEEEWRVVCGNPDYEVSNYGEVKRCKLCNKNRHQNVGKILSPKITSSGYKQFVLYENKEKTYITSHRLVAITFIGLPLNSNFVVSHLDGNKLNNFVGNLKWVSNSENQLHRREHEKNKPISGKTSLNVDQVKEIRREFNNGISCANLQRKYNFSHGIINRIVNNVSYTKDIYYG